MKKATLLIFTSFFVLSLFCFPAVAEERKDITIEQYGTRHTFPDKAKQKIANNLLSEGSTADIGPTGYYKKGVAFLSLGELHSP